MDLGYSDRFDEGPGFRVTLLGRSGLHSLRRETAWERMRFRGLFRPFAEGDRTRHESPSGMRGSAGPQ